MDKTHSKLPWGLKSGYRIYSADNDYITGVDPKGQTETCPIDEDVKLIVESVNNYAAQKEENQSLKAEKEFINGINSELSDCVECYKSTERTSSRGG